MQSVEHLVEQHHLAEESKESLARKISFEQYQEDFSVPIKLLEKDTLLDVGTGQGNFIQYLRETLHNKHAFGVDFNISKTSPKHSYLAHADIQSLPYNENLFDLTLFRNVIHGIFLSQPPQEIKNALSELVRVTKHGGQILYAIKSPSAIKKAILANIENEETQETLLQKLSAGLEAEASFLEYLQTLGHTVSVVFKGSNSRRIVKITKRNVQ